MTGFQWRTHHVDIINAFEAVISFAVHHAVIWYEMRQINIDALITCHLPLDRINEGIALR